MRTFAAALLMIAVLAVPALAGEKELLAKFKQQNSKDRDKLQAQIKEVLEKAQALEKAEPARALGLLQDTRDKMLQKGLLTTAEDRALAEPLWERIQVLRRLLRDGQAKELRASLAEYKDYLGRMNEEFALVRQELVPPAKEAPPGGPAYLAFTNGKLAVGWLHESPRFVVSATVNDQPLTYPPGVVAGVQTPSGYFLYDREHKRFVQLSGPAFFMMALAGYPPSHRPGFWMPAEIPPPPEGFFRRSASAAGAALFARSAAKLMTTWAGPGGRAPTHGVGSDAATARLLRDVTIELQVQQTFHKLKRADQDRFRDVIAGFLDRRPNDSLLTADEIVRLSDVVAEIYPERRSDAVAFAHILNRIFEKGTNHRGTETPRNAK